MEAVATRTCSTGLAFGLWLGLLAGCAAPSRPVEWLSGAALAYPPAAKAAGIEGSVTVRYDVTAAGAVANARVVASAPAGVFDAAALAAVRQWRFRAAVVDGAAVPARGRLSTLRFTLGEGPDYAAH